MQQYAFGKRGRPRFEGQNQRLSVEGKHHDAGIHWRKDSQVAWQGLTLEALIDKDDPVHPHGRQARVKYVRLQRKLDRQRRANHPDNAHADGRVRPGVREWHPSARYRRTQQQIAAYRKSLHGQLVNEILAMGDVFQFETISYRGLQRQYGRRERRRAPGKFMALLKRKAERAGAAINQYDPQKSPFAVVSSLWKGEDEALVPTRSCPLQLRTERESEPIACDSG